MEGQPGTFADRPLQESPRYCPRPSGFGELFQLVKDLGLSMTTTVTAGYSYTTSVTRDCYLLLTTASVSVSLLRMVLGNYFRFSYYYPEPQSGP